MDVRSRHTEHHSSVQKVNPVSSVFLINGCVLKVSNPGLLRLEHKTQQGLWGEDPVDQGFVDSFSNSSFGTASLSRRQYLHHRGKPLSHKLRPSGSLSRTAEDSALASPHKGLFNPRTTFLYHFSLPFQKISAAG
ncbi:hypothetical protein GW7_12165 [Heterocephalus glaber]|uniref:Uncharacterized protein n=1 Tax=Heterocephalus glaber TaxID=10181 RepID=G5BKX9_HETGA|nr:hypothetical protein GW7_12165 [Heterocephalus glaber]